MSRHTSSGRGKVLHNKGANLFPSPLTKSHSKSTLKPFFTCQPVKWNQRIYLPSCVFIQCAGLYMSQERKERLQFIMSDNMSLPNNREVRELLTLFHRNVDTEISKRREVELVALSEFTRGYSSSDCSCSTMQACFQGLSWRKTFKLQRFAGKKTVNFVL